MRIELLLERLRGLVLGPACLIRPRNATVIHGLIVEIPDRYKHLQDVFPVKRLLLDNNSCINAFEKKLEPSLSALSEALAQPGVELVLSEELLVEFAQSDSPSKAEHLLSSALQHKCVWLQSFADIQRQEVGNFVLSSLLKREALPVQAFSERYDLLPEGNPVCQPIDFLRALMDPAAREQMAAGHKEHADILNRLQVATDQGAFTPEVNDKVMRSLLPHRLSEEVTEQTAMAGHSFEDVVAHCLKNMKAMYKACPSMYAEKLLSDFRASDPTRSTRPSDSIDLTLSVAAFPYVDEFWSGDGYLYEGLQYVKRRAMTINTTIKRL